MPTYEYKCGDCGHRFEVFQRMTDDPVSDCEECGGDVQRVLFPVAVHFKGTGFYTTDYARKKTLCAKSNGNGGEQRRGRLRHVREGCPGSPRRPPRPATTDRLQAR